MKPDASRHNPDPRYLRGLLREAGLTQQQAASRIDITDKALRNYLSEKFDRDAPYAVQYALEGLARDDMSEKLLAALRELVRYAPGRYADDPRPDGEIDAGREAAFAEAQRLIEICERDATCSSFPETK